VAHRPPVGAGRSRAVPTSQREARGHLRNENIRQTLATTRHPVRLQSTTPLLFVADGRTPIRLQPSPMISKPTTSMLHIKEVCID